MSNNSKTVFSKSNMLRVPVSRSISSYKRPVLTEEHIDIKKYDYAVGKMRDFFKSKGWVEVNTQYRRSILAACEDPWTIRPYDFDGKSWPLPQTGQMWLEHDLLKNPDLDGVFTVSTSYRDEPEPIVGRHQKVFPMFEFEGKGDMDDLKQMEHDLLDTLGFIGKRTEMTYEEASLFCATKEIEPEHEIELCCSKSDIVFLEKFPEYTSPFWNMKREGLLAKKVDVLIFGDETIGSAEREKNPQFMRDRFETISDGKYAKKIRHLFGEKRVNEELDAFLKNDFFSRYGGGIGINRLVKAMEKEGIFEKKTKPQEYVML